jgi:hypothetical protein
MQGDVAQDKDCMAISSIYSEGRELRRISCAHGSRGNDVGIITIGVAEPTPKVDVSPFGFPVVIWNYSDDRIEVDWRDWTMSWTNRRGQRISSAPLDPDRFPAWVARSAAVRQGPCDGSHKIDSERDRRLKCRDIDQDQTLRYYLPVFDGAEMWPNTSFAQAQFDFRSDIIFSDPEFGVVVHSDPYDDIPVIADP